MVADRSVSTSLRTCIVAKAPKTHEASEARTPSVSPLISPPAEHRQPRPDDDRDPDHPHEHRRPPVEPHRLLEEKRAEHDDQQRHRIADRDRLRQRQLRQRIEPKPHAPDGKDAAPEMPQRPVGLHPRDQLPAPGEENDDRHDPEERAEKHHLPRRHPRRRLEQARHAEEHADRNHLEPDPGHNLVPDGTGRQRGWLGLGQRRDSGGGRGGYIRARARQAQAYVGSTAAKSTPSALRGGGPD